MGTHNSSLCSAPRRDVGACCRRKVRHPTCPTKNLCRHWAELLSLFLWAFCSQEGLSCWLNVLVEVMHLGTCERKQHTSQSQVHWKRNPNRELPKSFMFYFHNLSWSEGNIGEREKLSCETKSWEKLCAPSPFHAFQNGADSVTGFTAARLGLPLAASAIQTAVAHPNGEISWNCLAGTAVESLPVAGIASQQRSTWGALLGSPGVCSPRPHCPIPLYRLSLKTCRLQMTILTQAISF